MCKIKSSNRGLKLTHYRFSYTFIHLSHFINSLSLTDLKRTGDSQFNCFFHDQDYRFDTCCPQLRSVRRLGVQWERQHYHIRCSSSRNWKEPVRDPCHQSRRVIPEERHHSVYVRQGAWLQLHHQHLGSLIWELRSLQSLINKLETWKLKY